MLDLVVLVEQLEARRRVLLQHAPFHSQVEGPAQELDEMITAGTCKALVAKTGMEGLDLAPGDLVQFLVAEGAFQAAVKEFLIALPGAFALLGEWLVVILEKCREGQDGPASLFVRTWVST